MFDSKNASVSDYQFLIILYYYKLGDLPILLVNNIDELHCAIITCQSQIQFT